jgi:hypothetical protein
MEFPSGIQIHELETHFPHNTNIFKTERWFSRDAKPESFKNNKNKFYHLHIPKTAGNYVRSELTSSLEESFKENDIAFVVGHLCWVQYIDQYTYIFSTLRDPAKRTASHFAFMVRSPYFNLDDISIEDRDNPSVKDFMTWLDTYPHYINNFQAKNLIFNPPTHGSTEPNNFFFFKEPSFLEMSLDEAKVWENVKRIDLLMKDTQLTDENMKASKQHIFDSFGISESKTQHIMDGYKWHNVTENSKKLYNRLSRSDIDKLYDINKLDSEIYFTDSLFWRGGK